MKLDSSIDARRVFVTGLSAGGAMTHVMATVYLDVFAGASSALASGRREGPPARLHPGR